MKTLQDIVQDYVGEVAYALYRTKAIALGFDIREGDNAQKKTHTCQLRFLHHPTVKLESGSLPLIIFDSKIFSN